MRTVSLRLDDHTDALLAAYCQRHGLTQTSAIKAAIEHLTSAERPTPADLAARFGLIGGARSAEGDLAEQHSLRVKQRLRARIEHDAMPLPELVEPRLRGRGSQ